MVFEKFLPTTVKLRTSSSSAGEQFQANRQLRVALKPAVQRKEICKNENNTFKELVICRGILPCEAVWGPGNRNPGTFRSFGYKRTYAPRIRGKFTDKKDEIL